MNENHSLSNYREEKPHRVKRIVWYVINRTLFRLLALNCFWSLRRSLLHMFGAKVDKNALIYSSCDIFAPWNLEMDHASCIGPNTIIYNKDKITIGKNSVVSQGSYLCTAGHDITSLMMPLKTKPISIGDNVWIAADAFICLGVNIGDGAVVGARSAVFKNVEPWTIVGGNPAKFIKKRIVD